MQDMMPAISLINSCHISFREIEGIQLCAFYTLPFELECAIMSFTTLILVDIKDGTTKFLL